MKSHRVFAFLFSFVFLVLTFGVNATTQWWKACPPIIISPELNQLYETSQSVTHCWALSPCVVPDSVSHYELQMADAPTSTYEFNPTPEGNSCEWDPIRTINENCWVLNAGHNYPHCPIYWRVRTVYNDGTSSYWAVGYYLVRSGWGCDFICIISPDIGQFHTNYYIHHEWTEHPDATGYEVAFCNSPEYGDDVFDNCDYDFIRTTTSNFYNCMHNLSHLPVYFLVRPVWSDGTKGNWAATYYFVDTGDGCLVGTEIYSWGKIKNIFR